MGARNGRAGLRPLPISTFGDVADLGHELHFEAAESSPLEPTILPLSET